MIPRYFTTRFMAGIDQYLPSLSKKERQIYIREGEKAIQIREKEGIAAEEYLGLVRRIGTYLRGTTGSNFTSDYQKIELTDTITLYSFQLPGGGNLNIFITPLGKLVLDTGYGCYYKDCENMLNTLNLGGFDDTRLVICTHGDADHCGASGYFTIKPIMHPVTKALLDSGTRNYGTTTNNLDILEKFYTTSINTMSLMNVPKSVIECSTNPLLYRGLFPVIEHLTFGDLEFEIWESLGGHIAGQILLYEPNLGLLFTSDAFINFATLSKERADYCSIADSMIGSVNVDSDIARKERKELIRLASELNAELKKNGKKLYICCGHGSISVLDDGGNLVPASDEIHYSLQ